MQDDGKEQHHFFLAGANIPSPLEFRMFERYTEKARRVIFFARYEASNLGQTQIESEHLLLGLLREDKALSNRLLRQHSAAENIRLEIEGRTAVREKVSTSVDMPLSTECKRILEHGAKEADAIGHKHIGTEHLLAGILREERCYAAELLKAHGVTLNAVRTELRSSAPDVAEWPGSGRGVARDASGGGTGLGRTYTLPRIEFVCGEEKLGNCAFGPWPLPRIGETTELVRPTGEKRYRVRDIVYRYENPFQPSQPAGPPTPNVTQLVPPEYPFIPVAISIQLEVLTSSA